MLVHLVRHGESEANRAHERSLQARPGEILPPPVWRDPALTELGRRQAVRAGQALRSQGVERLYTSPLLRALETAHEIAAVAGCRVEVWGELCETFFSSRAPFSRSEITARFPDFALHALPCDAAGDWWTALRDKVWDDVFRRASASAGRLRELAKSDEGSVAVVVHGGLGSSMLDHLLELSPAQYVRFELANCSFSTVKLDAERGVLRQLNNTEHLTAEMRAPVLLAPGSVIAPIAR